MHTRIPSLLAADRVSVGYGGSTVTAGPFTPPSRRSRAAADGRVHYPVPVNGTGQSASPFWLPLPATEAARLLGKGGGKRFPFFLCLSSVYSVHSERLIRHVVLEQYRLPSQMAAADIIALPINTPIHGARGISRLSCLERQTWICQQADMELQAADKTW